MNADADDRLWKFECQLARKVVASSLRTDQALYAIKQKTAKELSSSSAANPWHRRRRGDGEGKFHGMCFFVDEVRLGRAVDDLLETYRRLTRPEKVGRQWSTLRWCLVATTLAKLRCLANVAQWYLPPPAQNTSRDPKALSETGISDASAAAAHIEMMEGEVDARIVRVAARLASFGEFSSQVSQLKLSPEAHTMARLALANLRNTASKLELLLSEAETRAVAMQGLEETYGALAASLSSLRQRLGQEIGQRLQALQEPLMIASNAARSLGLGRSVRRNDGREQPPAKQGDAFKALHQATLLTNIASLTEVQTPRNDKAAKDQLLALLAGESTSSSGAEEMRPQNDAAWNIEFTAAQLRKMQQAKDSREPKVHGAQILLNQTLECYAKLANAMSTAFGNETTLRANPAHVANHNELLKLVRDLRGLWKDSGVVLVPSRATDLLALEQVRCRHEKLVLNVLQKHGLEAATVVLARLALVDEMIQEPGTRLLTGEVSFELLKPYQLLESIVRSLSAASVDERRRRRWLRCPHASLYSVLSGEVWRQMLERFLNVEAAFEPLQPCEDIALSFREFRIALCLLEVVVSERLAVFLFEAAADTSGTGQATTKGLHDIISRYGATTSGDRGMSTSVAAAAARSLTRGLDINEIRMRMGSKARAEALSSTGEEGGQKKVAISTRAGSKQTPGKRSSIAMIAADPTHEDEINLLECLPCGAPMVCSRCIDGHNLLLPYSSVQELNRTCCAASRGSDAPKVSTESGGEKVFNCPEEQTRFGEDTIISWSTAVLTQSILLAKDERGIYFTWLARIVLFGLTGSSAEAAASKDDAQARENSRDGVGNPQPAFGRRSSFSNGQVRRSSFSLSGPEASHARKSVFNANALNPDMHNRSGALRSREEDETKIQARRIAEAKAKAEAEFERAEYEEALREVSMTLPETVLNVMRIDLGLEAVEHTTRAQSHAKMAQRSSTAALLYSDITDVVAKGGTSVAQRAKRVARVARLFVNLRHLNVLETDLSFLQRELDAVAENAPPNVNGILLVAGAARAAQGILARKAKTSPRALIDLKPATKDSSVKGAATHGVQAQKVIESSTSNAQYCYDRCGYEFGAQKVAAALRFLEQELFQGSDPVDVTMAAATGETTAAFLKVGEDGAETVEVLAPLLLPKKTANRLLDQAQREEEEDVQRQAAEAKASTTTTSDPKGKTPLVRLKSINTPPSVSSAASSIVDIPTSPHSQGSGSTDSRRPRSHRSQRESHRSYGSRHASNSRDSQSRNSRGNSRIPPSPVSRGSMAESSDDWRVSSSASGFHVPTISMTPWFTTPLEFESEALMWQGQSSDWPPEVLRLFSSVQVGSHRIRAAVPISNTFRMEKQQRLTTQLMGAKIKAADCMIRSHSSPTLLPRVARPFADVGKEKRYKRVASACRAVPSKGWSSKELSDGSQTQSMFPMF